MEINNNRVLEINDEIRPIIRGGGRTSYIIGLFFVAFFICGSYIWDNGHSYIWIVVIFLIIFFWAFYQYITFMVRLIFGDGGVTIVNPVYSKNLKYSEIRWYSIRFFQTNAKFILIIKNNGQYFANELFIYCHHTNYNTCDEIIDFLHNNFSEHNVPYKEKL